MVVRKLAGLLILAGWLFFVAAFLFNSSGQCRAAAANQDEAWSRGCSLATFQGTYVAWEEGTFVGKVGPNPPGPFPVAIVARVTFNGAGKESGTWSGTFGGVVSPPTPFTGTYTVNPDCTFSDEFSPSPSDPSFALHHWGTTTGYGMYQEVHYIYTDAGTVMSGSAKKAW